MSNNILYDSSVNQPEFNMYKVKIMYCVDDNYLGYKVTLNSKFYNIGIDSPLHDI